MIALPLLNYRLKTSSWNKLSLDYPQSKNEFELVIMLPIWNESLVIEKKLNNLISDYKLNTYSPIDNECIGIQINGSPSVDIVNNLIKNCIYRDQFV